MTLTTKQAAWNLFKIENPNVRAKDRGVAVTVTERRKDVKCVCIHSRKHHTKSGHCRPGCACNAGANRP